MTIQQICVHLRSSAANNSLSILNTLRSLRSLRCRIFHTANSTLNRKFITDFRVSVRIRVIRAIRVLWQIIPAALPLIRIRSQETSNLAINKIIICTKVNKNDNYDGR